MRAVLQRLFDEIFGLKKLVHDLQGSAGFLASMLVAAHAKGPRQAALRSLRDLEEAARLLRGQIGMVPSPRRRAY